MTAQILSEKSTHFSFLHSCCCLSSDLADTPHVSSDTSVRCLLPWGFGAPVTVLDGGCWCHAGVECGSRGRPGQLGLAFGHKRSVSEGWHGFLPCLLRPVSNQTSQPDSGSDSNENQMVTREECEKQKKGESERRKFFLWLLWERK